MRERLNDLITMTSKVKQMQQMLQAVITFLLAHIIRSSDQLPKFIGRQTKEEIWRIGYVADFLLYFQAIAIEVLPIY